MNGFKKGDRVIYTGKAPMHTKDMIGLTGTIIKLKNDYVTVNFEKDNKIKLTLSSLDGFNTYYENIELLNPYSVELE